MDEGRSGRQNFFMEQIAAGKAGAEKMAATRLIRRIQESISSLLLLWRRGEERGSLQMLLNQAQRADNSPRATHAQGGPYFDATSVPGSEQRETLSNWLLYSALTMSGLLSASQSLGSPAFISSGCIPKELWRSQGQGCPALWRVRATQQRSPRAGWTPRLCHL